MKRKISKTQKSEKPFSFHLGNLLIILAFLTFFLVFYPLISVYFFPPKIKQVALLKGNYITVPKISAQAPLYFNVDPFNEKIYMGVLKKGVAHAKGSALPGEKGSVFIFAHSTGNPLEITNYNTVFLKLGQLQKNDEIIINANKKIYKYKVVDKKIVWPSEIKYLTQEKDQLIVQTCWPIGTSLKRLLIFATPE